MRCFCALMVCLAALALGACGLNPSGTGTGTTLRVANLMPGTTAVTVTCQRYGVHVRRALRDVHQLSGHQRRQLPVRHPARRQPDAGLHDDECARQRVRLHVHRLRSDHVPGRSAARRHTARARADGQLRIPPRQRFPDRGPDRRLPDGAGRRSFHRLARRVRPQLQQLQQFRQRPARQLPAPDHAQRNEGGDLRLACSRRRRTAAARRWSPTPAAARASSMSRSSPTATLRSCCPTASRGSRR